MAALSLHVVVQDPGSGLVQQFSAQHPEIIVGPAQGSKGSDSVIIGIQDIFKLLALEIEEDGIAVRVSCVCLHFLGLQGSHLSGKQVLWIVSATFIEING